MYGGFCAPYSFQKTFALSASERVIEEETKLSYICLTLSQSHGDYSKTFWSVKRTIWSWWISENLYKTMNNYNNLASDLSLIPIHKVCLKFLQYSWHSLIF